MQPIKSFEIVDMTLSGFKCYSEETEFNFGHQTVITGGNGRGKSSIADAIAFAITGLPFFGERGVDRMHADNNPELFIRMHISVDNGTLHELTRTHRKNETTITYDGRVLRQADLNEMFGERDVFLSILNPLYFIEELGDEGKKLLTRYLPDIPEEQILSQLGDKARAALSGERILAPEAYMKRLRESIKDLSDSITYTTGQKDFAEKQREGNAEAVSELQNKLDSLIKARDELEKKKYDGIDKEVLQDKLMELGERYHELSMESADTAELDRQINELHSKSGKRSADLYVPKHAEKQAELEGKVAELTKRFKREEMYLRSFRIGVTCPTCKRAVTEADLPNIQSSLNASLEKIASDGKAAGEQLNDLRELERQTKVTFEQFRKEDIAKLTVEIGELKAKKDAVIAEHSREIDEVKSRIGAISAELECGNLDSEEADRLKSLNDEIDSVIASLAAAKKAAENVTEDFDAKLDELKSEIEAKKQLLGYAGQYINKRMELLFSALTMNRVQISLYDVVKTTGEVKDVFKFTYNGRRYDRLSLSEKVRAGMEVSELIKRLTGRNYPQFVDNMESVDDLANVRPTGQVIMAKCVKASALSVRPIVPVTAVPRAA